MNLFLLYLLLVKATLTSFSGLTSLAIVRQDFVVERHLLTDQQLTTAIAAGRLAPGPNGVYLVGVGYFLAGYPGAAMGWLALLTPAFLSIPLLGWLRRHQAHLFPCARSFPSEISDCATNGGKPRPARWRGGMRRCCAALG